MRSFLIPLFLVALLPGTCEALSAKARGNAHISRSAAEGQLRKSTQDLARALLKQYSHGERAATAARNQLAALANRYRASFGPETELLSRYILPSLPTILIVPAPESFWDLGSFSDDGFADELPYELSFGTPSGHSSSVIQSSFSSSNGVGQTVTKTTHCENGECEEHTEVSGPRAAEDADRDADASSEAMSTEIAGLLQALQAGKDILGFGGLESIFGDLFKGFGDIAGDVAALKGLTNSANGTGAIQRHSVVSQTYMKDGKLVTETKECVNGKCTTEEQDQRDGATSEDKL